MKNNKKHYLGFKLISIRFKHKQKDYCVLCGKKLSIDEKKHNIQFCSKHETNKHEKLSRSL